MSHILGNGAKELHICDFDAVDCEQREGWGSGGF